MYILEHDQPQAGLRGDGSGGGSGPPGPLGGLIRFPLRRVGAVVVLHQGGEWFAIAGDHGSFAAARTDADEIARGLGLPVRLIEGGRR